MASAMFEFSFCRLCLCSSGRLLDIFMKNSPYKAMVVETLEDLMRLKVVKEDRIPWIICHSCLIRLKEFRDFKTCCLRNKLVFDSLCQISTGKNSHSSSEYKRKKEFSQSGDDGFARKSKVECPASPTECGIGVEVTRHSVGIEDDCKGVQLKASDVVCGISDNVESMPENCQCTMCQQEFVSLKEMNAHTKVCWSVPWHDNHSPGVPNQIIDRGKFEEGLSVHGSRPFDPTLSCSRCGKTFRTKRLLVRHIEKHDFKCGMRVRQWKGNSGREGSGEGSSHAKPSVCAMDCVVQAREVTLKETSGVLKNLISCERCERKFKTVGGLLQHVCRNSTRNTNPEPMPLGTDVEDYKMRVVLPEEPALQSSQVAKRVGDGRLPLIDSEHDEKCKRVRCCRKIDGKQRSLPEKGLSNVDSAKGEVDGSISTVDFDEIKSLNKGGRVLEGVVNGPEHHSQLIQSPVVSLTMNQRVNSGEEVLCFICDYCQKSYDVKEDLRNHIVKCHLGIDLQKCSLCHMLFTNINELEEHLEIHPKGKKFYCTICKECFRYKTDLRKHIIGSHNVSVAFICTICCNGFLCRADLGLHHTLVHTESDKRFSCDECGKKYVNVRSYRSHLKVCQLKSVCFKCNICGKELSNKANLDFHMVIHSKVKKYACNMCEKVFKHCQSRNLHERRVHLKIHPHECQFCNKRFSNKFMVKLHYVSHSDHRPFPCLSCPKLFKTKYELKYHVLRMH